MEKKGFDNLVNKEQGELRKKPVEEDQVQSKPKEETPSCEHNDRTLGKDNQENHGTIIFSVCNLPLTPFIR